MEFPPLQDAGELQPAQVLNEVQRAENVPSQ